MLTIATIFVTKPPGIDSPSCSNICYYYRRNRFLIISVRPNICAYNKLKFIYSEKAKKFCEISSLLLSVDKSKVEFHKLLWPS